MRLSSFVSTDFVLDLGMLLVMLPAPGMGGAELVSVSDEDIGETDNEVGEQFEVTEGIIGCWH